MSNYVRAIEEDFGEDSEAIFDPVNDTEETAWNENYPAEAISHRVSKGKD